MRVAYHAACSLQHGQKVTDPPKALLKAAGFEVLLPADGHLCCGSAGTYNLMQPEISGQLKTRKVATLEALRPEVIAAGNIGCMMQIGSGTEVPVVHSVELLDWATGGPVPPALSGIRCRSPVRCPARCPARCRCRTCAIKSRLRPNLARSDRQSRAARPRRSNAPPPRPFPAPIAPSLSPAWPFGARPGQWSDAGAA